MAPSAAPVSRRAAFFAVALAVTLFGSGLALLLPSPDASPEPERGPGSAEAHYRAGQRVEIWQNQRWLPGKIQAVGDGQYFVFYDGFSVSWNEWVGPARLRPLPPDPPAR